jgi:DNA-binding transcriptional regulator LsrR (DeoR family)
MSALPETRLITKVATLYNEQKLTQTDIAKRLGISQVTVSRLLKRAEENQIVRTTVISPPGAFVELEDVLEKKFELTQAIVGESQSDREESIQAAVGAAAAYFLMTTVSSGEVIGVSSWSASLLAMVDQMHPVRKIERCTVVQVLGGLGNPAAEAHANHLVTRLARLVNGEPCFLPAPGVRPGHLRARPSSGGNCRRKAQVCRNTRGSPRQANQHFDNRSIYCNKTDKVMKVRV